MSKDKNTDVLGTAVDMGTMNIVSARRVNNKISTNRIRNAFLELPPENKRMLKISNTSFVEVDGKLLVIGDEALETANLFNKEARRPMSGGILASGEFDAQQVIGLIVKSVLGAPKAPGEKCCYAIPAAAVDVAGSDITYHSKILGKIISELGFTPEPVNEALAIVYSECVKSGFSGIGISYGSGMTNVCLSYNAMSVLEFSLGRCLSDDFLVLTKNCVKPISEVSVGDYVLDANGNFVSVLDKINNGYREKVMSVKLENLSAFSYGMTPDHNIFVKTRYGWEWRLSSNLKVGDKVGVPVVKFSGSGFLYFGSDRSKSIKVSKSRNLGRFIGAFLGDGKACLPKKGGYIEISIDSNDHDTIDKYTNILSMFGHARTYKDSSKPGVTLIHLESKIMARFMRNNFYLSDGTKCCGIPLHEINDQMAIGIIEGLIDTDGNE